MTTPIQKFIAKLSRHEKDFVADLIEKVISGNITGLNIKKLEGHTSTFRLRKGHFRIIYSKKDSGIEIVSVTRRSESTYRDF